MSRQCEARRLYSDLRRRSEYDLLTRGPLREFLKVFAFGFRQ
jgi:hypothetical protein